MKSAPTVPMMSSLSQIAAPPPGDSMTIRAAPSQMKKKASVTTMSGTRVSTTERPLMAPTPRPMSRMAMTATMPNSSPWPSMRAAAETLSSVIMAAIERSMPPAMMAIVWPAVAKA